MYSLSPGERQANDPIDNVTVFRVNTEDTKGFVFFYVLLGSS